MQDLYHQPYLEHEDPDPDPPANAGYVPLPLSEPGTQLPFRFCCFCTMGFDEKQDLGSGPHEGGFAAKDPLFAAGFSCGTRLQRVRTHLAHCRVLGSLWICLCMCQGVSLKLSGWVQIGMHRVLPCGGV